MTDAQIRAALTDTQAVALTLWGEARSEPVEGIIAVGNVIRHRRRVAGRTWKAVVHRRLQFSCWWPQGGRENYALLTTLARQVIDGVPIVPGGRWHECLWVADGVMSGAVRDTVEGARHYLTKDIFTGDDPPAWVAEGRVVARIGRHVFLAGVR